MLPMHVAGAPATRPASGSSFAADSRTKDTASRPASLIITRLSSSRQAESMMRRVGEGQAIFVL
ncbi:hypothetical protein DM480_09855 [Sphingomonas sp. FARSPH]|nr:hypothetical protein DM480_09855 [Sphingomonas sp. FARSPH]